MFDSLRKKLYFKKLDILWKKGTIEQKIVPFDEKLYENMAHIYFGGLPVSMQIKFLKPITRTGGKCFDRSLMMFFCFPNAFLVNADIKSLELDYGKENSFHYWIEMGEYVYDPSLMRRFDKSLYYEMYQPNNVSKCTKEEYCMNEDNKKIYDDIVGTTITDYQPDGKKRYELMTIMPLVLGIATLNQDSSFLAELNEWLGLIRYSEILNNGKITDNYTKKKNISS